MLFIFFFFKQKTAYEMRISDWSSDVCSSDLYVPGADPHDDGAEAADPDHRAGAHLSFRFGRHPHADVPSGRRAGDRQGDHAGAPQMDARDLPQGRSEEHTSELQSLMRISYAVFCLKKKNTMN